MYQIGQIVNKECNTTPCGGILENTTNILLVVKINYKIW
jgi:hypothetical protein